MREHDIRTALLNRLAGEYAGEKGTLIFSEFGLCNGASRVDVAVVNGSLNGYEIKSPQDTLERLPRQVDIYGKVLDYVVVVSSGSHLDEVLALIPEWWGIWEARSDETDTVLFEPLREPGPNPSIDPYSLVRLLWRDETLGILHRRGLDQGIADMPRRQLWSRLAESVELQELSEVVRQTLKAREGWRVPQPQK